MPRGSRHRGWLSHTLAGAREALRPAPGSPRMPGRSVYFDVSELVRAFQRNDYALIRDRYAEVEIR